VQAHVSDEPQRVTEYVTLASESPTELPQVTRDVVAELEKTLGRADAAQLANITGRLAKIGGTEARGALMRAADSSRVDVRDAAYATLMTVDALDVREFMRLKLNGEDARSAVGYFSDCRDPQALPGLARAARVGGAEMRAEALSAIVAQGRVGFELLAQLARESHELADAIVDAGKEELNLRPTLRAIASEELRRGAITKGSVLDYLSNDSSREALTALTLAARTRHGASIVIPYLGKRGDSASLDVLANLGKDACLEASVLHASTASTP
jgi:hypothetical protein